MSIEVELEYWKRRCELAENYIAESPCDPDILKKQLHAYSLWQEFKDLQPQTFEKTCNHFIPADKNRCQAEKPNGANAFTIGSVSKMIRCNNTPTAIVIESEEGKDGHKGSMSLCADCLAVAVDQLSIGSFVVFYIE